MLGKSPDPGEFPMIDSYRIGMRVKTGQNTVQNELEIRGVE
jgi:hypothetical protein